MRSGILGPLAVSRSPLAAARLREPLADLAGGGFARAEVTRLGQLRLAATGKPVDQALGLDCVVHAHTVAAAADRPCAGR